MEIEAGYNRLKDSLSILPGFFKRRFIGVYNDVRVWGSKIPLLPLKRDNFLREQQNMSNPLVDLMNQGKPQDFESIFTTQEGDFVRKHLSLEGNQGLEERVAEKVFYTIFHTLNAGMEISMEEHQHNLGVLLRLWSGFTADQKLKITQVFNNRVEELIGKEGNAKIKPDLESAKDTFHQFVAFAS